MHHLDAHKQMPKQSKCCINDSVSRGVQNLGYLVSELVRMVVSQMQKLLVYVFFAEWCEETIVPVWMVAAGLGQTDSLGSVTSDQCVKASGNVQ